MSTLTLWMSWQGDSWWCLSMPFLQRFHFTMKGCGRWRSDECNVTCSHPTRGSLIIFLGCEKSKCKFYPLHMYLMFFFLLTTVLLSLVPSVLYRFAQLNFLHFMSILADFWNFSHLHFKKYFPIISCLLTFGIMIH